METCPLCARFPVAAWQTFTVKLPQISRVLVSALGPEDPRWDLCWSVGSSAKVQQDGETCCPSQEWERGSTFYCFFLLSCVLFIFPTHKRLRGPRFSRASVLAAPSPPHQERDQLRIQTLLTRGTQARAAHPK